MNRRSISIVITCYNYGEYISQCLQSIVEQTFTDFEAIIVNDGSTDDSEGKIKPFLEDKRFKYIKQENAGQANAKNTGIKNSTCEVIAFLDADDIWEPTKLEKQIKLFREPIVGVVYSRAKYIDANSNPLDFVLQGRYLQPRSGRVTKWLIFDNFVPFSSSVVRRECFEKVGLFDESLKMGIDWDLWLRISVHYDFDYVDEPLLIYRIGHAGQMSKNIDIRQECSDRILRKFQKQNKMIFPRSIWREARAYSSINRSMQFRSKSFPKAIYYLLRGLYLNPSNSKGFLTWFVRRTPWRN